MQRIGVVGCGGMGTYHAGELAKLDNVEIVAVADPVKEKANELGQEIGARSYSDFREILGDVDVIWDCTPPYVRPEIVIECAQAGKHIFSEKPLALDLDTADRLVEEIASSGITFMTDYVSRFLCTFRVMHDAFTSGELGRLVNFWSRRYGDVDMRPRWFGDQAKSGGVTIDLGSHEIDLARWFGGEVKTVFGHVDRVRGGIQADEVMQAQLIFEQGMGSIDVAWWAPVGMYTHGLVGTHGSILALDAYRLRKRIAGGEEEIIDLGISFSSDNEESTGQRRDEASMRAKLWPDGTPQEHFIQCVEQGTTPLVTAADARAAVEITLAIQESARTQRSVDLPLR